MPEMARTCTTFTLGAFLWLQIVKEGLTAHPPPSKEGYTEVPDGKMSDFSKKCLQRKVTDRSKTQFLPIDPE